MAGPSIDAVLFEGHRYVVNDPVPAVLILPLVMLVGTAANQTLLACLLCGLAIGAAWALLERIGVTNRATIWLVVFFLAGTDLLWCSMLGDVWFIAQTSAVAFVLLALCELAGKRRGWLVALWTALALGSRFTLVMALPVLLWWVWDGFLDARAAAAQRARVRAHAACRSSCSGSRTTKRAGTCRGTPGTRSSTTKTRSWARRAARRSRSPTCPIELYSFFVVPPRWHAEFPYLEPLAFGTALWFTSPALLFALLAREPRRLVVSLWVATLLVAGPSLLYYANGGSQFGMRHALDFEPFVLVLMGLAARHGPLRLWRVAQALIVWSVARRRVGLLVLEHVPARGQLT